MSCKFISCLGGKMERIRVEKGISVEEISTFIPKTRKTEGKFMPEYYRKFETANWRGTSEILQYACIYLDINRYDLIKSLLFDLNTKNHLLSSNSCLSFDLQPFWGAHDRDVSLSCVKKIGLELKEARENRGWSKIKLEANTQEVAFFLNNLSASKKESLFDLKVEGFNLKQISRYESLKNCIPMDKFLAYFITLNFYAH